MKRLIELREAKGVSKAEVARFLGITRQAYSNYESGTRVPNAKIIERLATYYQVKTDDILQYDNVASIVYLDPPEFKGVDKEAFELFCKLPETRKYHYAKMFSEDIEFINSLKK